MTAEAETEPECCSAPWCLLQEEKVAVARAKDFLESNTYSADDPYTTALSAYALALLRSPYAPLALRRLNHMAITQGAATAATQRPGFTAAPRVDSGQEAV